MNVFIFKKPAKEILRQLYEDNPVNSALDTYSKKKIFEKFAADTHTTLYIAKVNHNITGSAFLQFLNWDSNIFGFKIGRIENLKLNMIDSLRERFLKRILLDCKMRGYKHVSCRLPLGDFRNLAVLEKLKFNVMDMQITLSTPGRCGISLSTPGRFMHPRIGVTSFRARKKVERTLLIPGRIPALGSEKLVFRMAQRDDLSQIKEAIAGIFTHTRFTIDQRFPQEKIDNMYFEWAKNSFSDSDKFVFILQERRYARFVGFAICNIDMESKETLGIRIGSIELVAIVKEYRNNGIGSVFVKFILDWFGQKADKVEIRTQITNTGAINAFMKAGFKKVVPGTILPAGIALHRWF